MFGKNKKESHSLPAVQTFKLKVKWQGNNGGPMHTDDVSVTSDNSYTGLDSAEVATAVARKWGLNKGMADPGRAVIVHDWDRK